jgi:glycosyltransferase involved in cell wall biosynthesis
LKRVLVVIPFEGVYPPMNGGMVRCINLLNQLAKYFQVFIITHQHEKSFAGAFKEYPHLQNSKVISTKSFRNRKDIFSPLPLKLQKAARYRFWNRSLFSSSEDHFLMIYPALKDFLKNNVVDFVILEALFIVHATAKVIRRYQPNTGIIYNAYNVDSHLAETALANGKISKQDCRLVEKEESALYQVVDRVFACSDNDLIELQKMNNQKLEGIVIPNGVKIDRTLLGTKKKNSAENKKILFCGSMDYFPNQEGLTWFCKKVLPLILKEDPLVRLMVVGKGNPGEELQQLLKQDCIFFYGMVDRVDKYYKNASVAVVPLLSGSGTRLKLLEAMGSNTATVSTTAGAEGINYANKKNILIADDEISFAKSVIQLLNNRSLADSIATSAYDFVRENYDWNIIGKRLELYLSND